MKKIVLPIYFHTDNSQIMADIGVKYDLEACEVRNVTFYHINLITPYKEDGSVLGTMIHSNGDMFLTYLSPEQVEVIIHEWTNCLNLAAGKTDSECKD